jgi:DNA-binding transcriptional LysR family regulator
MGASGDVMDSRINLNRLVYFTTVVDTGSFTAAARRLGVVKAVVSHQVAQLEGELGVMLLERTTRRVVPTEIGRRFDERCRDILDLADGAVRLVREAPDSVHGVLRLGAPDGFTATELRGPVRRFLDAYPDCRVEVVVGTAAGPEEAGLDLVLRPGPLEETPGGTPPVARIRHVPVAAPSLLDGRAAPASPADLPVLRAVGNGPARQPLRWRFQRGADAQEVVLAAPISVNCDLVLLAYLRAGLGWGVVSDRLVADDLAAGTLVRLLPEWELVETGFHAALPANRPVPARVSAFLDILGGTG